MKFHDQFKLLSSKYTQKLENMDKNFKAENKEGWGQSEQLLDDNGHKDKMGLDQADDQHATNLENNAEEENKILQAYREAFDLYSEASEGTIARDKLRLCLECLNLYVTEMELDELLKEVVFQNKEPIDFESFKSLVMAIKANRDSETELIAAFRNFDLEGKGYISAEELHLVLTSMESTLSEIEAQQIEKLVISRDGRFYYRPFVQTLKDMGFLDD